MPEEVIVSSEQTETTQVEPTEVTTTPVTKQAPSKEDQAREQGWVPKEEWTGDPDKWRPAAEFVDRGELFGKIEGLGKELKETRKALKMLQEHHTKVKETEYNRAVEELKSLQKKHLEDGNSDGYLETTELLTDLKAEQKARAVVAETAPNVPHPHFVEWTKQNIWYNKDQEMHEYADAVGLGYAQQHPHLEPEEVLEYVSKQVRGRFRERFVNPNRNKPSSVEGSGTPPKKQDSFELTQEERKVMNAFVRTGAMSADEYISDLKKIRGVK